MRPIRISKIPGNFAQECTIGPHKIISDALPSEGGQDRGPSPHEYLAASLGFCTTITLEMYAKRKGWPLENTEVEVMIQETPGKATFERKIHLVGPLDEEQKKRLFEIAERCPVHKTLSSQITIQSTLV